MRNSWGIKVDSLSHIGYTETMDFIPIHRTNNLFLRYFANQVCSPIGHYFFTKGLRIYFKYEKSYEEMDSFVPPFFDKIRIRAYVKLYDFFNIPYDKWGTIYKVER